MAFLALADFVPALRIFLLDLRFVVADLVVAAGTPEVVRKEAERAGRGRGGRHRLAGGGAAAACRTRAAAATKLSGQNLIPCPTSAGQANVSFLQFLPAMSSTSTWFGCPYFRNL